MKHQPNSVDHLLNNSSTLSKLRRHSRYLQLLTETVRSCLPPACARQLQACSFDGTQLTLYASNAAAATTLRMACSQLMQSLRQEHQLHQIQRIRVRITVTPLQSPTSTPAPHILTDDIAKLLGNLAQTASDPAIREILRRISKRHKIASKLSNLS